MKRAAMFAITLALVAWPAWLLLSRALHPLIATLEGY